MSNIKDKLAAKANLPMVSVCTPTFNRRPFIPIMFECFRNQTYPKSKIEWIIVDDGTDKVKDLIETAKIPQIRYFEVDKKMTLGAKRNYMHSFAKGSIIVYMDDDDYYPPERISHAVERLQENKGALCAGASEIYIYFKHIQKMIQCGPYGPNHATAGTFAFRKELLNITKYEETASIAEERAFLKDYTIPFVQLDPLKTILVFSHEHNTFDKRKMLENPHPDYLKESTKTVDSFIRTKTEGRVKTFFMTEIDKLLEKYAPGLPTYKPDVLLQIKEIEKKREEMAKVEMAKNAENGQIMMNRPGQEPVKLSNKEVVELITQQQQQIQQYKKQLEESSNVNMNGVVMMNKPGQAEPVKLNNKEMVDIITQLQQRIEQQNKEITDFKQKLGDLENLENMILTLQKQLTDKVKEVAQLKTKVPTECTPLPSTPLVTSPGTAEAEAHPPIPNKSEPEITIDINMV